MEETLIVGAGPAGLATAACLAELGMPATLLERSEAVGSSWRHHYERLHLHTARQHSALPGLDFPDHVDRWPSRQQVVEYLDAYAAHHRLDVRFGTHVRRVASDADGVVVSTTEGELHARRVVLATGYTRVPVTPSWPGRERFRGTFLHSAAYVNGEPFRGRRVLVVGIGNSGGEIALDLAEHGAEVTIAVRSAVNVVPREILGVPILAVGIATSFLPAPVADAISAPMLWATVGDIRKLGFRKLPYGPVQQIKEHGRIPLIDIGTIARIRAGEIVVRGDVKELDEDGVSFEDGVRGPFDAVVAATGFVPRLDEIAPDLDLDEGGRPRASGAEVGPGIFVCGFHVAATGMLREIGIEARRIAALVGSRVATGKGDGSVTRASSPSSR